MEDFALVVCSGTEEEERKEQESIFKCIKAFFMWHREKEMQADYIRKLDLYDDLGAYIIRIPLGEKDFENKHAKTDKILNLFIKEYGPVKCIIPEVLAHKYIPEPCVKSIFDGKRLYKALAGHILKHICAQMKLDIRRLEVALLCGDREEELFYMLNELSPYVKYLTLITDNKKILEDRVDTLCTETGLSVGISSDIRGSLKEADCVINLKDNLSQPIRLKKGAFVLNFGTRPPSCNADIVINSIYPGFPERLKQLEEPELLRYFDRLELAELILCHHIGIVNELLRDQFDIGKMERLARSFIQNSFHITDFVGRNGLLECGS